jgi:hypothetical protein
MKQNFRKHGVLERSTPSGVRGIVHLSQNKDLDPIYVLVFVIVSTCRSKKGDSNDASMFFRMVER